MAVASIGTTTVTALSRRIIRDVIVDNVYGSNVLFFRWNRMNKIIERGGFQIEQPLMWTPMSGGGWYTGPQVLAVPQSDTIQNSVFAWKQAYGNVTVDGLTQLQADSPMKVADYLASQFKQAEMQLADLLGFGVWSDGTNTQTIDGVIEALGNNSGNYGGISQSGNPWWNSQLTTGATTMTLSVLNSKWIACQSGGQVPTVICGDKNNYSRYWALNQSFQQFPQQPGGQDTQLAQAGFTNLVFNNVPWLQDDHAPTNNLAFLNENYWELIVNDRANFYVQDFVKPPNQDAMTSLIVWAGNMSCSNLARQGLFTNITA
jgi:hypothetical protein